MSNDRCGFSSVLHRRYSDEYVVTHFSKTVPVHVRRAENGFIILESFVNNVFIKVIDCNEHNLNCDVIYPINYLLQLQSIISNPKVENYCHDILFNVTNYLLFLKKHNIAFSYSNIIVIANAPDLDNAFWNGTYLTFGAGVGQHTALTSSAIVGHELTHALTQQICDLEYRGHSGALNESFSDVFGVCFENWIKQNYHTLGFEIGLECNWKLRDMQSPWDCQQPMVMYDRYYGDPDSEIDNGYVHRNSGIPNHIFVCIYKICGFDKAFELFVQTLYKLKPNSQFLDFKRELMYVNFRLNYVERDVLSGILNNHIPTGFLH